MTARSPAVTGSGVDVATRRAGGPARRVAHAASRGNLSHSSGRMQGVRPDRDDQLTGARG